MRVFLDALLGKRCRQARQQHRAECNTEQRGWKLHQPVGKRQPGDAAGRQVRRDVGVDDDADLRDRHRKQRRQHQPADAAHVGIAKRGERRRPANADADRTQREKLHRKLQHAADDDSERERHDRPLQMRRQPQRARDKRNVQQHRRGSRHREPTVGVQHAGRERHQRHEQDVRKHPARHHGRQLERIRVACQTGGDQPHQYGRGDDAQNRNAEQHPEQRRRHASDERARAGLITAANIGEHRNERLLKRAFGEHSAQQIGNAKRDVKGVGLGADPEDSGDQHVPRQPGDAGNEGQAANGGKGAQQCRLCGWRFGGRRRRPVCYSAAPLSAHAE